MVLPGGVVNAASGATGGVAPGTLVSVWGYALGPPEPVASEIPQRRLADVEIWFGSRPALLTYVSNMLVRALVPFSITGERETTVGGRYRDRMSGNVRVPVLPADPGVFTADASGVGPASALNEDGTVNGAGNPAPRGSVVTLYVTGLGETDPPSTDGGWPATPEPPKPQLPWRVRLAGHLVPADHLVSAVMDAPGIWPVRFFVPGDTPVDRPAEVVVEVECAPAEPCKSQPGVTLAVR